MKFLLTRELGRLAKWLRILGFDTRYFKEGNAGALTIEALREGRTVITRNHHLPQSRGLKILVLEEEKIKEQVKEALKALKIEPSSDMMFSRCTLCNVALAGIEKEKVKDKVPEYVFQTQNEFRACRECARIYWQGTHWGNVLEILEKIK